jgi:excisionase family DNA binding protein
MDEKQILISIGEAADYLGVSIDTLRRWERKGKVEALRSPGNHRYFDKNDLDNLFGKKYERKKETKPRDIEKLVEAKKDQVLVKDEPVSINTPILTTLIPNPNNIKVLLRETRNVQIPPPQAIRIIQQKVNIDETIQIDNTLTQTQVTGISESILTPPVLRQQEVQNSTTKQSVIAEKEVSQKPTLSTKTLAVIIFTFFAVIAAVVVVYIVFSPPKIISPLP